jgi:hypothetical protein
MAYSGKTAALHLDGQLIGRVDSGAELSKLAYEWPSERRDLLNGLKRTRAN